MAASSSSSMMPALSSLTSLFPLTSPPPTYITHPSLLPTTTDLDVEQALVRSTSLPQWHLHLSNVLSEVRQTILDSRGVASPITLLILGERLATPEGRQALQRTVDVFERALAIFPTSYKVWKMYLEERSAFVLGKAKRRVRLDAPKRKSQEGGMVEILKVKEADMEDVDRDVDGGWDGALQGTVGWEEWRALAGTFERALIWLPQMPRIWLMYLTIYIHPSCPAPLAGSHARRTFDRALRTLPPGQHERIWRVYLRYSETRGGPVLSHIYHRYLRIDPSPTEHFVSLLLSPSNPSPRPLEAAKLLLGLARRAAKGEYKSPEGKSPYQLLGDWLDVVEKYAEQVGLGLEEAEQQREERKKEKEQKGVASTEEGVEKETNGTSTTTAMTNGSTQKGLVRVGGSMPTPQYRALHGNPNAHSARGRKPGQPDPSSTAPPVEENASDTDPASPTLLDIEHIIRTEALPLYRDQAGRLWTGLATFWIKIGEFDKARETFEEGVASVVTIRDFTQIFDAYAEFDESYIGGLMDSLGDEEGEEGLDEEERKETEKELDVRMKSFEELMDRRPFLVNDVLLRRNPNDVQEWEKRVALYGDEEEKVAETYRKATETINPRKASEGLNRLWVSFAKYYEEKGKDVESARKVWEKAVGTQFRKVDELAEVWCEWAEMEVRNENYDEAIRVMQRATAVPRKPKGINYHDESLSPQARLFKSLKLWAFYIDLEESIGTVESTKAAYNIVFDLKIANAQTVINFASFLEENGYWEESFKVYERGVDAFPFPIAFEIWNTYLSKFIKRFGGDKMERARDLFEQALEKCPAKLVKPLYLMYGHLEEEHGLAKRAMAVYERACEAVAPDARFEMYTYYIAKVTENFGLPATRPIYQKALEILPDREAAEIALRFAALERKLGEIDRARSIYAHGSQFCDPRTNPKFWAAWNQFEIDTGSEDTFREYLRIKRATQAAFNTSTGYLAARAAAARQGQTQGGEQRAVANGGAAAAAGDAMASLERQQTNNLGFVKAKDRIQGTEAEEDEDAEPAKQGDENEIEIDEDDL